MKIQCDVCNKEEASVFCSADEAALCGGCDRRVHHANKLAGKHTRFSLQRSPSSSKESPRCDICQEKRAILFCQEDRAILCRDCDIPIHKANEHTQKHSRFLLTGARLSASSSSNGCDLATDSQIKSSVSKKLTKPSFKNKDPLPSASTHFRAYMYHCSSQENLESDTSSISEYLMETLPGWQVDDFLDPSCKLINVAELYGNCVDKECVMKFCRLSYFQHVNHNLFGNGYHGPYFLDHDVESVMYPFLLEDKAIRVPQAPI